MGVLLAHFNDEEWKTQRVVCVSSYIRVAICADVYGIPETATFLLYVNVQRIRQSKTLKINLFFDILLRLLGT